MPEQSVDLVLFASICDLKLLNELQSMSFLALEHVRPIHLKSKKIVVSAGRGQVFMKLANPILSRDAVAHITEPLLDNGVVFKTVRAL